MLIPEHWKIVKGDMRIKSQIFTTIVYRLKQPSDFGLSL